VVVDDAVVVRIVKGVRVLVVRTQWTTLGVTLRSAAEAEDDRLDVVAKKILAQVDQLVVNRRVIERRIPAELGHANETHAGLQLDSLVLHLADVGKLRCRRAGAGRQSALDQRVLRLLVEVGEVETQAVTEDAGLKPDLSFLDLLRPQVWIAEVADVDGRRLHTDDVDRGRIEVLQRVHRSGT